MGHLSDCALCFRSPCCNKGDVRKRRPSPGGRSGATYVTSPSSATGASGPNPIRWPAATCDGDEITSCWRAARFIRSSCSRKRRRLRRTLRATRAPTTNYARGPRPMPR